MAGYQVSQANDDPVAGSRRVVMQAIAAAGVVTAARVALRSSPAGAQEATPEVTGLPRLDGTTFVGTTSDPETFVAIVVAAAAPGEAGEARAYVCNGADIVDWFDQGGLTGEGEGKLDLRSEAGAHLEGTISGETATGTVTLPGGTTLDFEAPRATGTDGLYTFSIGADGRAEGSSAEGASIAGQLLLVGAIALPDGESESFEWPVLIDDVADLRTIYRAESGRRGSGKTKKGVGLKIIP
jgi:hypothetical protein